MATTLTYSHILCPVDFSETSRQAFLCAIGYMRQFGARLTVLHIRDGKTVAARTFDELDAENSLTKMERRLLGRYEDFARDEPLTEDEQARVGLFIAGGKPFMEILRVAAGSGVDLIVMGTHGHTGFKHIFMGSTAERVVRHATCHVLSVKPPDFEQRVSLD